MERVGYTHVYTGDGKGKTTAALGLALRAAGAGLRVLIIQFMKGRFCSEHRALESFAGSVTVEQYGSPGLCAPGSECMKEHGDLVKKGFARARHAVTSGEYDVVILDEAVTAVSLGLIAESDLIGIIKNRGASGELVLTGRGASETLIEAADLVTEMKCVKHYFERGVPARDGIEK